MNAQYNIADILDGVIDPKVFVYKRSKYVSHLDNLKASYKTLSILNTLLYSVIPENLHNYARIGAIDKAQMAIIIFTSNVSAINNIKEFTQIILRRLDKENYNFNSIMFKVKVNLNNQIAIEEDEPRIIDDKTRQKLLSLATIIGKPELILNTKANTNYSFETEILI